MKIDTLQLDFFRSFVGLTLPTNAPRVLIAGVNGSGKTSVREALKWAFLGRCDVTDKRGVGADQLAPAGYKAGGVRVGMAVHGIGAALRHVKNGSAGFTVEGFSGPSALQQQALFQRLETTEALLEACLDTDAFLRLHHADAKALIMAILNVRVKFTDDPNDQGQTLDQLDHLYQSAFEDRKVAKRRLQQCIIPARPEAKEMPLLADIDLLLVEVRNKLEAASERLGAAGGQRQTLEARRQAIEQEREQLALQVPAQSYEDDIAALEERIGIMEGDDAGAPPTQQEAPKAGDPHRMQFLRGRIAALAVHNPAKGCVIEGDVPCKTAKKYFTDRWKALQNEVDASAEPAVEPSGPSPLAVVRKELEELHRRQTRADERRQRIERLDAELQALNAKLDEIPDTSDVENEVATLKGRIARGEKMRSEAESYWRQQGVVDQAEADRQALQAEVNSLEVLCDKLGPNGIRVQVLQEEIGKFAGAVNQFTAPFGYSVAFDLEPWAVRVNGRRVETFSKSERFRIGVALQLAIAAASGLSFAVVDEVDMLTSENNAIMTRLLLAAPVEQVFVLSSREPDRPLPNVAGVLAYRFGLQEGKTVVMERSGA